MGIKVRSWDGSKQTHTSATRSPSRQMYRAGMAMIDTRANTPVNSRTNRKYLQTSQPRTSTTTTAWPTCTGVRHTGSCMVCGWDSVSSTLQPTPIPRLADLAAQGGGGFTRQPIVWQWGGPRACGGQLDQVTSTGGTNNHNSDQLGLGCTRTSQRTLPWHPGDGGVPGQTPSRRQTPRRGQTSTPASTTPKP